MTAKEKLNKLLSLIEEGKTIIISTHMRAWKINKSVLNRFGNRQVLKEANNSLYMSTGNKYVCIDYCKITYI